MTDIDSLASALFGSKRAETQEVLTDATTRTYVGTALSDSKDGTVMVDLGGDVTLPDDVEGVSEHSAEGIEVSTGPGVRAGDEVVVTLVGGTPLKTPMVTGVAGEGDGQDARIAIASAAAEAAWDWADEAHDAATDAQESADEAQASAESAASAASAAVISAASAEASAQQAIGDAAAASSAAASAQASAQQAIEDASDAKTAAIAAEAEAALATQAASDAVDSAEAANRAANGALAGLGTLESVIDTVEWFAEHKVASTDTTVQPGKSYYEYDESAGTLSRVEPEGTENPSQEGWYELDETIQNYVASHVSTTDDGLYVSALPGGWRVLVSTGAGDYVAGVFLVDPQGNVAQATTGSGITFDGGKPFYIGDNDAFIVFDGDGGIQMGGAITLGQYGTLTQLLNAVGSSITAVEYGVGTSPTSHTDITTWSSSTPAWEAGKYVWMRTTTNGLSYTYTCIQGADGQQGEDGAQILGITTAPSSYTTQTGGFTPTYRISLSTVKTQSGASEVRVGDILAYSYYHYPVGYVDASYVYCGAQKSLRGAAGSSVTVSSTDTSYASSTSGTTIPTSGWQSTVPSVAQGSYLWTRVVTTFSDSNTATSHTASRQGENGTNGTDGTSVTVSSTAYAYQLSTSGTTVPTGTWQTTPQAPTTTQFAWTRTTTTYSDGSTAATYTVGGKTGTDGTSYYTHIRYATDSSGANMSPTPTSSTTHIGIYTGTSSTAPSSASSYTWSRYVGEKGDTGPEAVVTISPTSIDWDAGTAVLAVTLRVDGTITTPSAYKWTKGTSTTSLGTGSTLAVTDLNATYNCTVTW